MTIRSGGRARERSQAHPAEHDTGDSSWLTDPGKDEGRGSRGGGHGNGGNGGRNGGNGRRRSGGVRGLLKFLAFAAVLGAIVLVATATVLRPVIRGAVIGWATDNPAALGMPFVADLVKEDLGARLTQPASTDSAQLPFVVSAGETAAKIAERLQTSGFLTDKRSFIFIATEKNLTGKIAAGTFILRKSMTPDQIVEALLNPDQLHYVEIALRTGLRLEQITAKLETINGLKMDPEGFYKLASRPTPALLADYAWLKLPDGASLEGYLWPANYRVLPDTTPEELIRLMLDKFRAAVGDRMTVPTERGRSFYEILTLASMVEREAVLDEERQTIAGVFENRLHKLNGIAPVLASDPTVIYAADTVNLAAMGIADWKTYRFWDLPDEPLGSIKLPADLAGFQTYRNAGLIPAPICTPTLASIDAALAPDTASGYLFFLAKNDGSNGHAFAKDAKEHQANRVKYGYG